jgi:glutamine synthetase
MRRHSALLRAAAASAGNERRLGANEAPPAIMSVFLGERLSKIIGMIESGKMEKGKKQDLVDLGVSLLPKFMRDAADRNRTSPFAFTGSKFEFRALGSSMNVSTAVTVINTIVADSMDFVAGKIKRELKKDEGDNHQNSGGKNGKRDMAAADAGADGNRPAHFTAAVLKVLGAIIKESKPILFDGNSYSGDWAKEAEKRGLPNAPSTAEAIKAFIDPQTIELFGRHKVFTKAELEARYNIWLEKYEKTIDIEARTLAEIANTQILPCAYGYQSDIASGLEVLRDLSDDMTINMVEGALEDRKEAFEKLTADIYYVRKNLKELDALMEKARGMDLEKKAAFLFSDVRPQMDHIRKHVDALESAMPDEAWPLPKYREMLFLL